MVEDYGAPETGQLSRAWTRRRRDRESPKSGGRKRVRSWAVQNTMRSDMGRMTVGAAERILDSANSSEIRV